jgi:MmyB-like transcription regulator ligand binding domain
MILHLAEQFDVPLRDRNVLLLAGGYAPRYQENGLAEPELKPVKDALQRVLAAQQPYPAVVVNRWWELVEANAGIALFTCDVAPGLLEPPVNVLRLSLHPDGMAPRIANLPQWRAHLLTRLRRQAETTGDPRLAALREELSTYPGGEIAAPQTADVVVPLRYRGDRQELSFLSITAVIGTPMDITVEELAIESFYPADEATAAALARSLRRLVDEAGWIPSCPSRKSFDRTGCGPRRECGHFAGRRPVAGEPEDQPRRTQGRPAAGRG